MNVTTVVFSPPYAGMPAPRTHSRLGRKGHYYRVKGSGAVVRVNSYAWPTDGTNNWWVSGVLSPNVETVCCDDLLEAELNEMEVLAWVAQGKSK